MSEPPLSKCANPPNSYYTLPFENDPAWEVANGNWDDPFHGHGKGDWPGLPAGLDAAIMWNNPRVAFFFKGSQYWAWNPGIGMYEGYPKSISEKWHGLPDNLDAAIMWNNGYPFFFKGSKYWAYDPDPQNERIIHIKDIAGNWHGVPNNIDAAIMWNNGKAYFFKGNEYWKYDVATDTVEHINNMNNWHGLQGPLKAPIFWSNDTVYFFQKGANWYYDYNPDPKQEGIRSAYVITDDPTQINIIQGYAFDFVHGNSDTNQTVRAARGGKVFAWVESETGNSYGKGNPLGYTGVGNFLVIQHLDGTFGTYWHLAKNGISNSPFYKNKGRGPKSGDQITRGDRIAISDNTGNASGPHLHFDVRTGWNTNYGVNKVPPSLLGPGKPPAEYPSVRIRFTDRGRACWIPVTREYLDHIKCTEFREQMKEKEQDKKSLQADLKDASPTEKPSLVNQINKINNDIQTIKQQMTTYHCHF